MNGVLRAAVGLLLFAAPAFAQVTPLTLQEAAKEALANNPGLAAATFSQDVARASVREARGAWLPRVEVSHQLVRSNNPVFVFGSLLEQGRFGASNFDPATLNDPPSLRNHRLALDVRLVVFDQLRRLHGTSAARNGLARAGNALEEARQELLLATITRFYAVLLAEEKRRVAESAVRSAESATGAVREKFDRGVVVESDLLASEVQLASFRQQLVEAEGDVLTAHATLNAMLGRDVTSPVAVSGEIGAPPLAAVTLQQSLADARAHRGALARARIAADDARLQVAVARGALLPRVDAFGTWGASGNQFDQRNSDHTVGVVTSLALFDPSRYTRIAAARAAAAAAEAEARAADDRVAVEVITAWNRVRSAEARVALATTAAQQATVAARIVSDRYENGLTTITESLRASTADVRAHLDLLAARYDYVVGRADLLRATGGLHDVETR